MPSDFPLGAAITIDELENDPHPVLARLRAHEPVSWVPVLDGWLVTSYGLAVEVMRDAERFTVDDPRFSTAQVVGPSMLSLDGSEHARHRSAFLDAFRSGEVRRRFEQLVVEETDALVAEIAPRGEAELRREFAGPLAAGVLVRALGLTRADVPRVLALYDVIVGAVGEITAGRGDGRGGRAAFAQLSAMVSGTNVAVPDELTAAELASNTAVLLFGGIETTEGMIANAVTHVLRHRELGRVVDAGRLDAVLEESLRLEPAAAVLDRYATADAVLAGVPIARGDLVRVSLTAANRDPAVFPEPDRFNPERPRARAQLAFAQGPHVCLGVHLARLEARFALHAILGRLPRVRLDLDRPPQIHGLVFRKPPAVYALWDRAATATPHRPGAEPSPGDHRPRSHRG